MRAFYDRAGVRVTEQWFTVGDSTYPVIELQRLFVVRGPLHPGVVVSGVVAAVTAGVGVTLAPALPVATVTGLVGVGLLGVMAALALARVRPARRKLWVERREGVYPLYASNDVDEFGKLTRALIRATGHADERLRGRHRRSIRAVRVSPRQRVRRPDDLAT